MKSFTFLLLIACVSTHGNGFSQRVSLSQQNVGLEKIFKEIHKQTGYTFVYTRSLLKKSSNINIHVENASIERSLDICFKNQPLTYTILNRMVVIKEREIIIPKEAVYIEQPEAVPVTGKVTDSKGNPLEGATILVKGTNNGVKSDANGIFSINADPGSILVVSYVGFETVEVSVGNRTNVTVQLKPSSTISDEVVVVGYSTQKRKDVTGSIASVDVNSLKTVPSGSALQALQGQASGVNIIRSGGPGGTSNIFIRGISSFGNTRPLILVDGVESDLDNINVNDIDNLQVLKDAGAASIYGVRGSNGVIIVTTKKGKIGKPIINYDAYYGIQQPLSGNVFNLLNAEDFARLTKQANPNTALFQNGLPDFLYRGPNGAGVAKAGDPAVDPSKYNLDPSNSSNNYLIQEVNKIGTDWFHELFKKAPMQNHSLTVSGATDKSNYLLSLGYFDQQGTMIETFLKRYSARINTSYKVNRNIRIGENLYFYYNQYKKGSASPITFTYRAMPIIPVYDIMGNFGGSFDGPELGASYNPVAMQRRTINDRFNSWNIMGNAYAEVDFLNNFTARTSFGGTINNVYNTTFNFTQYNNTEGNSDPNSFSESAGYSTNTIWTNTVSYSNHFAEHDLKVVVGSEAIMNNGRNVSGSRNNFFSTDIDYLILNNGTSQVTNSSSAYINTLFSLFGRIDYSYKDRYLIGGTVRRDGSSVFGSDKRYGVFPSFSAGWRISNENFMGNINWLNDLKIRGSYGILGSQNNVSADNAYSLYGGGFSNAYYDITGSTNSIVQGFFQTRIGNPRTGWERDVIYNIGLDALLLNNKVNFSIDYYKKSIKGLLFAKSLPATVGGATPPTVNVGDIQNTGVDISAGYNGRINKNLQFNVQANITTYRNLVVNVPDPGYFDAASTQVMGNVVRNQVGHPVSSFFGYEIVGLFKDDNDVSTSAVQTAAAPGRFKYKDVDGDGTITPSDRTFIGNPNPDFTYGLTIGLTYKQFDVSAILYGSQGNEVHNQILNYTNFFSTYAGAKSNVTLNAWTPENTDTKVPKLETQGSFSTSGVANSYYIENGSYFRLKSLVIGYTISPALLQRYGMSKFRFYVQAANLFTLTKYSGLDPELAGSSAAFGVDYANYPNNEKNFLVGLSVSF